ncbi:hypothetical protein KSS87_006455, partial [Heliosperma pusillum]
MGTRNCRRIQLFDCYADKEIMKHKPLHKYKRISDFRDTRGECLLAIPSNAEYNEIQFQSSLSSMEITGAEYLASCHQQSKFDGNVI